MKESFLLFPSLDIPLVIGETQVRKWPFFLPGNAERPPQRARLASWGLRACRTASICASQHPESRFSLEPLGAVWLEPVWLELI